jgi:hypothetical protein
MDYFSELLESYSKLKKRTFKLTYISEQEDSQAEGELIQILTQAPQGDYAPLPGDKYPGLASFNYLKNQTGGVTVRQGRSTRTLIDDQGQAIKDSSTQQMWDKLYKAMSGEAPEATDQENADSAVEKYRADEEAAALEASYNFTKPDNTTGEPKYSTDPADPANANRAIRATQETMDDLTDLCNAGGFQIRRKYQWCDKPGMYITGKGGATFTHKLTNGLGMGPDGETTPIPPGLLGDAAENHRDFLSFLTSPPAPGEEAAERCASMNDKVGYYNGKLLFFGKNQDSEGDVADGVAIYTSDKSPLYNDALKALQDTCGDTWNPTSIATKKVSNHSLNTVRGTVNEKALQLAVKLSRPGITKAEKKKLYKDLAQYIYEKRESLIEYAQTQPPQNPDDVAADLNLFADQEILMSQAKLAKEGEGGEALVRYTLGVIQQHQQFVQEMRADDAYDFAKGGGSGARSDTVFVYNSYEDAVAACERVGLDPAAAITKGKGDYDGKFEIGVGQKDKDGGISSFKMGEYNSTARRRKAFKSDGIKGLDPQTGQGDKDFAPGFYKWADNLQFGGPVDREPAKTRYDAMVAYEEELEAEVAKVEQQLTSGSFYIDEKTGKPKSQSPETICKAIGGIIKKALRFPDALSNRAGTEKELGELFYKGNTDWSDASQRAKAAELIGRQVRIRRVMENLENGTPEGQQAAKDWIVRNAMMTGGNARDIVQLQTSYSEGRSFATKHNEIFNTLNKKDKETGRQRLQDAEYSAKPGDSSIKIIVDGLQISLGFERTDTNSGPETRTVVTMPKATVQDSRLSRELKGTPLANPSEEQAQEEGTLQSFIRSQMKLFEAFLNQTK